MLKNKFLTILISMIFLISLSSFVFALSDSDPRLKHLWKMDVASGDVPDSITGTKGLTPTGAATMTYQQSCFTPNCIQGTDYAIYVDNDKGFKSLEDVTTNGAYFAPENTSYCYSFWANVTGTSADRFFLDMDTSATADQIRMFSKSSSDQYSIRHCANDVCTDVYSDIITYKNTPYLVTWCWNGTNAKLYLDGTKRYTGAMTRITETDEMGYVYYWVAYASASGWEGVMDDIALFIKSTSTDVHGDVFTDAEISDLYTNWIVDGTPPEVTGSSATVNQELIDIRANVTDDSTISYVKVEIETPSATKTNYTMSFLSGDEYNYTYTATENGQHSFKIFAEDELGNNNGGSSLGTISYSFQPDATNGTDTYINSPSADTNYGTFLNTHMANNAYAMHNFSFICDSIQSGSTIDSLIMEITVIQEQTADFQAYPITSNWVETVVTWNTKPTYNNTWNIWISPDISGEGKKNITFNTTWFQGECNNIWDGKTAYGFWINSTESFASDNTGYRTSDAPTASERPKIYIGILKEIAQGTFLVTGVEEDEVPPVFSNQVKNTTPYVDGDVELKITITDDNADSYKFFWNDTGSFVNESPQTYTSEVEVSTIKTTSTAHQNICWGYWANDTLGYSNTSNLDCFTVSNSIPTVVLSSPYDGDHNWVNLSVQATCSDSDSTDTISMTLVVNGSISDVVNSSVGNGVLTTLITTDMTVDGHYLWYINCSDGIGYGVSESRTYVLDTEPPILTILSPQNNSWYEETDDFDLNISGEDPNIYLLNYTLFNESGDILQSNQAENESSSIYISINDTVDIDALGFSNGDKIYINISTSDSHTGPGILRNLTYSYADGTITFYKKTNPSKGIDLDLGRWDGDNVVKLTTQQLIDYNVKKIINKKDDRFEFGANFTLPNTDFIFGFRMPKIGKLVSGQYAHFIIHNEYWLDYKLSLIIGENEYLQETHLVTTENYYYIYWNIDWGSYGLQADDKVTIITKSIGGLNIVERQYVVNIGSTSAPTLTFINCTSNPQGDTTERYDTYGDLTPTFDVTTDIDSEGYISSDNSTWVICTTTGTTDHTCTVPSEQELRYENQTVYVLFNNSYYDNKFYDVWDVFTGYYLKGTVKDDDDRVINNATVNLLLNSTVPSVKYSTTTNSSGDWDVGMPISGEIYMVMAYDLHNTTLGADAEAWIEVT